MAYTKPDLNKTLSRIPTADPRSAPTFPRAIDGTWAGDHTQAASDGRSGGAVTWEGRWQYGRSHVGAPLGWTCDAHPGNLWSSYSDTGCLHCTREAIVGLVAGLSAVSNPEWLRRIIELQAFWMASWLDEGWAKAKGWRLNACGDGVTFTAEMIATGQTLKYGFDGMALDSWPMPELRGDLTEAIKLWRKDLAPPPMWTERGREIERNHAEAFKAAAQTNRAANALVDRWGADGLTGTAPGTATPEVTARVWTGGEYVDVPLNPRGHYTADEVHRMAATQESDDKLKQRIGRVLNGLSAHSGLGAITFHADGYTVPGVGLDECKWAMGGLVELPIDLNNPTPHIADAIRAYARANYPHPCGEYEGQRKTCKQLLVADQVQKDLELVMQLGEAFGRTDADWKGDGDYPPCKEPF